MSKQKSDKSALSEITEKVIIAAELDKPAQKAIDPEFAERQKRLKSLGYATSIEDFDNNISENIFDLPKSLKDELESKGLAARFISYKKFKENSNMHFRGWKPYVMEDKLMEIDPGLNFQLNPEGMILRGQMVLAVKPQKYVDAYRERVEKENKRLSNVKQDKYAEMREYGKRSGIEVHSDD